MEVTQAPTASKGRISLNSAPGLPLPTAMAGGFLLPPLFWGCLSDPRNGPQPQGGGCRDRGPLRPVRRPVRSWAACPQGSGDLWIPYSVSWTLHRLRCFAKPEPPLRGGRRREKDPLSLHPLHSASAELCKCIRRKKYIFEGPGWTPQSWILLNLIIFPSQGPRSRQ